MAGNEAAVHEFAMRALGDVGSALTASLVVIGDKLGLYRAMTAGPVSAMSAGGKPVAKDRLAGVGEAVSSIAASVR